MALSRNQPSAKSIRSPSAHAWRCFLLSSILAGRLSSTSIWSSQTTSPSRTTIISPAPAGINFPGCRRTSSSTTTRRGTAPTPRGRRRGPPSTTQPCRPPAGLASSWAAWAVASTKRHKTTDLAPSYLDFADIDRLCPAFGCDGREYPACLSDDVSEALTKNGGVAQGAKLAIFDVFDETHGLLDHIGNGLWEPCVEAGCKLHSNSWGSDSGCETTPMDLLYDAFMHEVRWRGFSWGAAPWFSSMQSSTMGTT